MWIPALFETIARSHGEFEILDILKEVLVDLVLRLGFGLFNIGRAFVEINEDGQLFLQDLRAVSKRVVRG